MSCEQCLQLQLLVPTVGRAVFWGAAGALLVPACCPSLQPTVVKFGHAVVHLQAWGAAAAAALVLLLVLLGQQTFGVLVLVLHHAAHAVAAAVLLDL